MKKIFAIALVGLFAVAFTENANANAFDTDNEFVYTVGEYDAPVDVITFEIVPVTTDFVNNVAVLTVNSTNLGGFSDAVNTVSFDNLTPNVIKYIDTSTFVDVPIDYGIRSTNEFELSEPIPNLTEYVNTYNDTFDNEPEIVRNIKANVGKLTNWKYIL